ncbi:MAG: glycosyltransferase [Bacteroidetes bacterium]|nr:glycosyltransferase [Bacteroidota bacterium]
MSKLKIFILGPAFPLRGGPAEFNQNLCAELAKAGHNAQIISYKLQYPNFLFPGSSQFEKNGIPPNDIKIHTLINSINPINWFKVARFIKKEKPNFILIRFWLPFFGPCLGTIAKLVQHQTKVIALTDNVIPHEKRPGDRSFTKYFINNCNAFITMSKVVLNDLNLFTKSLNKAYHPHPMYETYGESVSKEEARKKLNLNTNDSIVLFFGLIRKYKGLDILLEAMADEQIKKLNIKLLIAGEFYDDASYYMSIIEKNKIQDRVILHSHFIPNNQVRYYFCAANVVAQTYRNATNSGVSMVSYYYNKPMIVTAVGGLNEIVPNNKCGYIVDFNKTEIAQKIINYFTASKEMEFTENVMREKQKYTWTSFIQTLLELHHSIEK